MGAFSAKHHTVFGCQEFVSIPAFEIEKLLAKVDTGAYTGALHCEYLAIVKIDGKKFLKFRPLDSKAAIRYVNNFEIVEVTSSNGHKANRYIIPVELVVQGKNYKTRIGLTNRKELSRQMLIGKIFLSENNIVVDVRRNEELDDEKDKND